MTEYETASLALQTASLGLQWHTVVATYVVGAVQAGLIGYGLWMMKRAGDERQERETQRHTAIMQELAESRQTTQALLQEWRDERREAREQQKREREQQEKREDNRHAEAMQALLEQREQQEKREDQRHAETMQALREQREQQEEREDKRHAEAIRAHAEVMQAQAESREGLQTAIQSLKAVLERTKGD